MINCLFAFNIHRLCTLELRARDVCDECVQLVGRVFIFITLSCKANSYAEWNIPDSFRPHVLVQTSVNADIRGAHLLLGKLTNLLDSARRPLLEACAMDTLVNIDRIFSRSNLVRHGLFLSFLLGSWHFIRFAKTMAEKDSDERGCYARIYGQYS